MKKQPRPDWEVVGTHKSGALLVTRIGGNKSPHKCCPSCVTEYGLRGPLHGWLVEGDRCLWCPDCGRTFPVVHSPGEDGVELVAHPHGKWHVIERNDGRFIVSHCGKYIRRDNARTKPWGEVETQDICAKCAGHITKKYGQRSASKRESEARDGNG